MERRNTRQRQLILEAVRSHCDHPTAEQIYRDVAEQAPTISKGTVYRNLSVLAQEGELTQVEAPDASRFDLRQDRHHHLVCSACGAVVDAPVAYQEQLDELAGCVVVEERRGQRKHAHHRRSLHLEGDFGSRARQDKLLRHLNERLGNADTNEQNAGIHKNGRRAACQDGSKKHRVCQREEHAQRRGDNEGHQHRGDVAAVEAGKHVCGNVSQCERAGRKGSIETEGLRTEALGIGSRPHALALGGLRVCIRVAMGAREERDGRTRVIHGKHGARGVAPPGTVELHEAVLHAFTCEAALKLGIQPCQAIAGACGRVQVVAHRAAEERTDFLDGRQGLLAGVARARDGLSKLGHGLLKDAVVTTPRRIKLLGIPAWRGCLVGCGWLVCQVCLRPRRCARWFLCHVYPCLTRAA